VVGMATQNLECPECLGNITIPGDFGGELICPGCDQIVYIRDPVTGVTWKTGAKVYRGPCSPESGGSTRPIDSGQSIGGRALAKFQLLILECTRRSGNGPPRTWSARLLWIGREVMTELLSVVTVLSQLFIACGAVGFLISLLFAITKAETVIGFIFAFFFYCIFNPLIWLGTVGVYRAVDEWGSSPLRK